MEMRHGASESKSPRRYLSTDSPILDEFLSSQKKIGNRAVCGLLNNDDSNWKPRSFRAIAPLSIQRRIVINEPSPPTEMNRAQQTAFMQNVQDGTLSSGTAVHRELLYRQLQLTQNALDQMMRSSETFTFTNEAALIERIAEMILPLYLTGQFDPAQAGGRWAQVSLVGGRRGYLQNDVNTAFQLMQQAAALDGHNLTLVSATRNFQSQRDIWNTKMRFERTTGTFGRFEPNQPPVSTRCADILTAQARGLDEWNYGDQVHRRCWFLLTEEERAREVLKTSSAPGTSRHHWGTDIDLCCQGVSVDDCLDLNAWNQQPVLSNAYQWLNTNARRFGFHQPYTSHASRGNRGYLEEKWHWSYSALSEPLLQEYQRLLYNRSEFQPLLQGQNVESESFILSNYQEYVGSVAAPPQVSPKKEYGSV